MQKRTKKIVNIALNILIGIVCVVILLLAVSTINSKDKGYNNILGYSLYAVKSDSMKGSEKDSFDKGALVISKVLKTDEQKRTLKVGDVVTFRAFDVSTATDFINTHRIIEVRAGGLDYITQGDNSPGVDPVVNSANVISVYKFHIKGLGKPILFMQEPKGFLIVVVIPSLLIVVYALYNLFRAYGSYNKAKVEAEIQERQAQERARDQARFDANKLAEEQAKQAAEKALAEKEAQIRAEMEAKIKAELQAEQAIKAPESKPPVQNAPAKAPAKASAKAPATKKPTAAKTTATKKPSAPKAATKKDADK